MQLLKENQLIYLMDQQELTKLSSWDTSQISEGMFVLNNYLQEVPILN